ncbi:MAG: response regulator [Bacteroidetes bacterium]|nr:response regulator [Bacteroidota bacterium]
MNNNWKNYTILIVEDDPFSAKLLKYFLLKTGINILWVRNGLSAVEMCRNHKEISLVIMDIELPLMNGIEASQEILNNRKDLPIIAQTGILGFREKCSAVGCVDFISKPTSQGILIEKINKYLNAKIPCYPQLKTKMQSHFF